MTWKAARVVVLLLTFITIWTSVGHAQTREFLRAPRVQSRVRVQWDTSLRRVVAAVDDSGRFQPVSSSQPFLTEDALAVTYPRLNPLRIAAVITVGDGAVPADAVTSRLRALLSVSAVLLPAPAVAFGASAPSPDSCPALAAARADAEALTSRVLVTRGSATVATLVSSWRQAIDEAFAIGRDGLTAVSAAVALMDQFVSQLDAQLAEGDRIVTRLETEAAKGPSGQPCEASARAAYEMANLANPRARLAQLRAVRSTVVALRAALSDDYVTPGAKKWQGAEYRLAAEIRPSGDPVTLAVRVTHLRFDVDGSGVITAMDETAGSDTMVVQRFSRFAREFAVASVVGSVVRPGYGTTTNAAGVTVVGRLPKPFASVEPAFLASFVCRCETGPLVAPMAQVGITTSKDVPALLTGGGIRLFGLPKGDVALGGGAMFAWVKDLRRLQVGTPVGGTSDIEADLGYRRRFGYYLALQYKF